MWEKHYFTSINYEQKDAAKSIPDILPTFLKENWSTSTIAVERQMSFVIHYKTLASDFMMEDTVLTNYHSNY